MKKDFKEAILERNARALARANKRASIKIEAEEVEIDEAGEDDDAIKLYGKKGTGMLKENMTPATKAGFKIPPAKGDALWLIYEFIRTKYPNGGTLHTGKLNCNSKFHHDSIYVQLLA